MTTIKSLINKRNLVFTIVIIIISTIIDTLTIGLIFPYLQIITGEEKNIISEAYNQYSFFSKTIDKTDLILFTSILLLLLASLKFILNLTYIYKISKFLLDTSAIISSKLYAVFLNSYKLIFKNTSSNKFLNLIQIESDNFIFYLQAIINLIAESFLIFAITVILFIIDFQTTIIIFFIFGISSFILNYLTKKYINYWGKIRQSEDDKISKLIIETYNLAKEIILYNSQNYFNKKLNTRIEIKKNVRIKQSTLSQFPRVFLEFILIISMFLSLAYAVLIGLDLYSIIPKISLFALAAFKTIPSLGRIIVAKQNLKYYASSVKVINEFLSKEIDDSIKPQKSIQFKKNIKLNGVEFFNKVKYNLSEIVIEKNKFYGFIGESGVGKSLMIQSILGLLQPTSGKVTVDDNNIYSDDFIFDTAGYFSQDSLLINDTIEKNIIFGNQEFDENRLINSAKMAGIYDYINSLDEGFNTILNTDSFDMSGGQKQRICLARLFYKDSEIFILDEPTSALDYENENRILDSVLRFKNKKTIILISHNKSLMSKCDKIYYL